MFPGCGEKGNFLYGWWECKLVQPLWKTLWRSKKIKIKILSLYNPAILLLGIWSIIIQSDTWTPMLIALFAIAKIWEQHKCT